MIILSGIDDCLEVQDLGHDAEGGVLLEKLLDIDGFLDSIRRDDRSEIAMTRTAD